jgi:diguanylate cyclase (GGDEF)-like protein
VLWVKKMADDGETAGLHNEEIQGAPPVVSSAELLGQGGSETLTVNRELFEQVQQLVDIILTAPDLQSLVETILVKLPRHFSMRAAELWFYDPEGAATELIVGRENFGQSLRLMQDVFEIEELYDLEPCISLIEATDTEMFKILKSEHGIDAALLMPLLEDGKLIGSLHLGMSDVPLSLENSVAEVLAHLASVISRCFKSVFDRERISQLTVLDPLTQMSNARGFKKDIAREISRARRGEQPLTLLTLEIDDYEELYKHYGERRVNFVIRKVAQRLSSDLRQTDYLARLAPPKFAVLLPSTGEMLGQEIADRMRIDVEDFPIDDGRGAILQACMSVGLVTWEPLQYPAVDMKRLALQMESVGNIGLDIAKSRGGNCVAQSRLSTMMV